MKKRKDTRDRIILQALTYFTVNDYDRISLNDIARAQGITKGGIYHYFGSKDELFKETLLFTVENIEKEFDELMTAYSEEDMAVSLEQILRQFYSLVEFGDKSAELMGIDVYEEYENLVYLLFVGLKKFPELRTRIEEVYTGQMNRLAELLECARRRGEIQEELDTRTLAFEIIAQVEGTLLVGGLVRSLPLGELSSRTFEDMWNRIRRGEP